MALYNTMVTVVANLEAPSESAAVGMLVRALEGHGFTTMTGPGSPPNYADAFEAEEGTPRDYHKEGCRYRGDPYRD